MGHGHGHGHDDDHRHGHGHDDDHGHAHDHDHDHDHAHGHDHEHGHGHAHAHGPAHGHGPHDHDHEHTHDHPHRHPHDHDHEHGGADLLHSHPHTHSHGHVHEHGARDHAQGEEHEHAHEYGGRAAHAHAHGPVHAGAAHAPGGHGGHEEEVVRERPFGPPRKRVPIGNGTEIATIDVASGPPILFLHGFPTSASLWRNVIAAIEGRARCVAPDLLGFGETTAPASALVGYDAQTDCVLRLLDALDLGEVTVVGHDIGGVIAQLLATRHADRIARLVLCDSPAFDYRAPAVAQRIGLLARVPFLWDLAWDTGILPAFARSRSGFRGGTYDPAAITDEAIDHYIRPSLRDTPPAYRASRELNRRAIVAALDEERSTLLACVDGIRRFRRPTLVVWGCEDPYVRVSYGKKLADEIPGCERLELIPFCGHWVPEERPAELAGAIAEFAGLTTTLATAGV